MLSHRNLRTFGSGWALAALISASLVLLQPTAAFADQRMDANQLVEKAQLTLQNFMCDEKMGAFRDLLEKAHGVLIVPSLLKGAFVVGASGGSGVLLVRDPATGSWSSPAFYTIGGASFGFQIGGQASEVVLLAMTDRGVNSFLETSVKLGGEVGVAAGPVGMGASAATANLSADIVSFSRSKGLYGGISLDGAVVAARDGMNRAYYGESVSPRDVLLTRSVTSPQGAALAEALAKAAESGEAARKCASTASVGAPKRG